MHVDVVNSVMINRPVPDVFQDAADSDNAPLWYVNIKSVDWKTPRPAQIGSRVDFVAHFLGSPACVPTSSGTVCSMVSSTDRSAEQVPDRCCREHGQRTPHRDSRRADQHRCATDACRDSAERH